MHNSSWEKDGDIFPRFPTPDTFLNYWDYKEKKWSRASHRHRIFFDLAYKIQSQKWPCFQTGYILDCRRQRLNERKVPVICVRLATFFPISMQRKFVCICEMQRH